MTVISKQEVQGAIDEYIAALHPSLRELNLKIHQCPELAYKERRSHDILCEFLESQGIPTTRHAYGLETAFEALVGDPPGRRVNFNAEYDALPEIGHACGHNLIATASVTAFLGLAFAIKKFGLPGQAQLLGTPAGEDGGGKIDLALKKTSLSLMMHPMSDEEFIEDRILGIAGQSCNSCYDIIAIYHGFSAHAAASPWEGVNALGAVVAAYNNISMLRQQLRPDERVHGAILQAPSITNAIPELTRTKHRNTPFVVVQSNEPRLLGARVRQVGFTEYINGQGVRLRTIDEGLMAGSTDQGNVSQIVPALHALVRIPVSNGVKNHTHEFTDAAESDDAHQRTVIAGKAMAMTGRGILIDEGFYRDVKDALPVAKGASH
ncbi:M20 family metallopeptidase [Aspergillus alliaceus]|uniref:M20 family metallopeptidase n=1 Tax=Petromyces alliaceus TaxID=209559 RepID=UPI0012A56EEF|nr:uncharacterized protein BDW43DRAFT_314977 [Aspergillus alliaceus]KAB8229399.1 hypothetical protein BDW43DRAFT_314977 [Aspergillus alliaceus]